MQTLLPKRAPFLHAVLVGALLAGATLGSLGCTTPTSGEGDPPFLSADTASRAVPRDSTLAVLTSMKRAAFDSAFATLDDYAVTRHLRTDRLTPSGTTVAVRAYTVRYPPGTDPGHILEGDSSGTFRHGGLLSGTLSTGPPSQRPSNVAALALSDQPAYLAPRTRDAYEYILRADSLRDGTPTHVVTARARAAGTGQDQGVRYARLELERATRNLIGLTVVRAEQALLFSENSRLTLQLRRAPDGAWVPGVSRFRAMVDAPFRTPRQFRTVSAYYNYTQ